MRSRSVWLVTGSLVTGDSDTERSRSVVIGDSDTEDNKIQMIIQMKLLPIGLEMGYWLIDYYKLGFLKV